MIMFSLSGFSILAGTICKQTAWNMLLDLVHVNWQGSWYKKLHDTSIAILVLPCNRTLRNVIKALYVLLLVYW
jgi:hypothetical protein